jgi:hypothetical protein
MQHTPRTPAYLDLNFSARNGIIAYVRLKMFGHFSASPPTLNPINVLAARNLSSVHKPARHCHLYAESTLAVSVFTRLPCSAHPPARDRLTVPFSKFHSCISDRASPTRYMRIPARCRLMTCSRPVGQPIRVPRFRTPHLECQLMPEDLGSVSRA